MTVERFIEHCDLPADWREWVAIEVMTGCTCCGRRLLVHSASGRNAVLRSDVTALRITNVEGHLVACHVLCHDCTPSTIRDK
jgi:hypothetical protein